MSIDRNAGAAAGCARQVARMGGRAPAVTPRRRIGTRDPLGPRRDGD